MVNRRDILAGIAVNGAMLMAGKGVSGSASRSKESHDISTVNDHDRAALLNYFELNARKLLRNPEGILRFPSVSPSMPKATYSTSLWDWDTLWTVRGLFQVAKQKRDPQLHAEVTTHAQGCIANFFDHQSAEGRIPMLISTHDPDPLHCLAGSRPHKANQAKPILGQLALLITEETGDAQWFSPYFSKLEKFYESWTVDNMTDTGLLVWGDDVAIGNDNDPTTFGRPFFSSANIFLNCFYYKDLEASAELARRLGQSDAHASMASRAKVVGDAIQHECWDSRDRFFYTADVQCVDRRAELIPNIRPGMKMSWNSIPIRIQTFTGFLPMWCKLTTPEQAHFLLEHLKNPETFAGTYGIRSLSAAEPMYSLVASSNPSNWLGPVWIIVNYLVWKGLKESSFDREATDLAARTVKMLAKDLAMNGSLNEYYHPDSGKPLSHSGFMDWNLLALEMV